MLDKIWYKSFFWEEWESCEDSSDIVYALTTVIEKTKH
jgi:hypothetical protein